ncbi:MAG TPA: hypothetical protein VFA03_10285 [Acetobacteraceae bacterium]|nr:hypothetical protein [Acetobacteraceae bacterium]
MPLPEGEQDEAAAEQVVAFLRARPRFLAERPELYRVLAPPRRVHGEAIADHMAAMIHAGREHAAAMAARADGVLAAGRAAAGIAGRVQEAVLTLIATHDVPECVAHDLPGLLGLDAATLCAEEAADGLHPLPTGMVAALLGGRDVLFREPSDEEAALVHVEAARLARFDALVRVPRRGPPALLALVARDPGPLDPAQGSGALAFLGRVIGAALDRTA